MNTKKNLILTQFFRIKWIKHLINFVLLLNFINLSANFYESQRIDYTNSIGSEDQLDTLSELIVEWVFEADDSTIPNDPESQDNQASKKIKLSLRDLVHYNFSFEIKESNQSPFFNQKHWLDIEISNLYSPPKLS